MLEEQRRPKTANGGILKVRVETTKQEIRIFRVADFFRSCLQIPSEQVMVVKKVR